MALVEAMACGLPVVSFDCPWGPRSIISDGEDGLLAENGNTDALAARLAQVMESAELRKLLSARALQSVRRFAMSEIAVSWQQLFDELVRKAPEKKTP